MSLNGAQRTLADELEFEGAGIHTGVRSRVVVRPAPEGSGLVFRRADIAAKPEIRVYDVPATTEPGRTVLGAAGASVQTVEHILAALWVMGVDNAFIEVEGPEIPAMDGSALPFARAVAASGLVEQLRPRSVGAVRREMLVREGGATLAARPVENRGLRVTYTLHYEASKLAQGTSTFDVTPETFLSEIAPARTFCMAGEVDRLRATGLGRGASGENTLVLAEGECIGNELRMPLEPLRHKVLDMLGDMALVGFRLSAHLVGVKSGHALNRRMAVELRASASSEVSRPRASGPGAADGGTGVAR